MALVHVAFGIGLGPHGGGGLFRRVVYPLVHVGEWHRVLLVDVALELSLQAGPLIVGERQGDERLRLAHELVNVALSRHLPVTKTVRLETTKVVLQYVDAANADTRIFVRLYDRPIDVTVINAPSSAYM